MNLHYIYIYINLFNDVVVYTGGLFIAEMDSIVSGQLKLTLPNNYS